MSGNSEDRYLPSGIINPIYNAVRVQAIRKWSFRSGNFLAFLGRGLAV
jgi:hypothetical protein